MVRQTPRGTKQQTISSFFSPRQPPIPTPKPSPEARPGTATLSTVVKQNEPPVLQQLQQDKSAGSYPGVGRKRSLGLEEADSGNGSEGDLFSEPQAKKLRKLDDESDSELIGTQLAGTHGAQAVLPKIGREADNEKSVRQKKLHDKFVKKLGRPDSILSTLQRSGDSEDAKCIENEEAGAEDEEVQPDNSAVVKKFGKGKGSFSKAASKKTGSKLTPLERQVVDIKREHPDTVLIVEVGYKFRFFGEDARTASQNLSIMCIPGKMRFDSHLSEAHLDRFASASIPVHRLHVHVKRLVTNGYKVGIVRQIETAALKAASENKNAPFERKLTNLYTKGTYIDDTDDLGSDISSGAGSGGAPNTGFLLCMTEKPGGGTGTDERAHVGMVAVQPSTGDIIYDEFDDGFMRSEVETRLLHIAPCEFLIVGNLTRTSEKLIAHLSGSMTSLFGDKIRIERVEKQNGAEAAASTHVSKFYADRLYNENMSDAVEKNRLLDAVLNLSGLVTTCLSAMITHLTDYGLEHVFDLTKYFQSFSARSHMLLNGNTLSSLEIYRNQTDYTTKGSLFWTLDRTKTKFGRRLLRSWVGRPLLDRKQLEARIKAVEEIKTSRSPKLDVLRNLLTQVNYDLEKGLIRIYYGRCTRPELLTILQTIQRIASVFLKQPSPQHMGFESMMINEALAVLPEIKGDVAAYLDKFNFRAAKENDKYDFFRESEEFEAIDDHKMGIKAVESDLQEHLKEIAIQLKKKVTYVTVSGIEYLVEVSNDKTSLKGVPASWAKVSSTKKVSRFHTPKVMEMIKERDQRKESLAAECDKAFRVFLADISTKYQTFRDCVQSLALLDCLLSLATVADQPGYVKPELTDEMNIAVENGRHPMVEQLLSDTYIPNDIKLCSSGRRAMLVTGPNMGGKSSYVRQVALISIMAQIGSYVPAKSAKLGLLDAVFTRMGAFDNMMAGESTFMAELSETRNILKQATPRSLVILDELGRGTSTHDGVAIAYAVLDYVINDLKSLCLFVTHYPLLAQFGDKYPEYVTNTHMRFEEAEDGSEKITFLYRVGEGVAYRSYGLNVARLAGLPRSCLAVASVRSQQLERELKGRESTRWARKIARAVGGDDNGGVEHLLRSLEHLNL